MLSNYDKEPKVKKKYFIKKKFLKERIHPLSPAS